MVKVHFDCRLQALSIHFTKGVLREETHYYPFGLPMAGMGSSTAGHEKHRQKYQGNEYLTEGGLSWMDFNNRQYEPQLRRFLRVDPLADGGGQQIYSPYAAMGNAPESMIDPEGLLAVGAHQSMTPKISRSSPRDNSIFDAIDAENLAGLDRTLNDLHGEFDVFAVGGGSFNSSGTGGGTFSEWLSGSPFRELDRALNKIINDAGGNIFKFSLSGQDARDFITNSDSRTSSSSQLLTWQGYGLEKSSNPYEDALACNGCPPEKKSFGESLNSVFNKTSATVVSLSDLYIKKKALPNVPKWIVGPYQRAIVLEGAKDYTSILSIQLRRLGWQHGGRIVQGVGTPIMFGTLIIENGIYQRKIIMENPPLDSVKAHYDTPWNPAFYLWMRLEEQLKKP